MNGLLFVIRNNNNPVLPNNSLYPVLPNNYKAVIPNNRKPVIPNEVTLALHACAVGILPGQDFSSLRSSK